MEKFGNDKPDMRFGLELKDMADLAGKGTFKVFLDALQSGGMVKALNGKGMAAEPRPRRATCSRGSLTTRPLSTSSATCSRTWRRLEEALGLIQRAVELQPDNGAFIDSLGWVYYRLGRLEQARSELERAVRLTDGEPEVREHLGDVYKDLRLTELAREQYRLALAADPANGRVKNKLADLP